LWDKQKTTTDGWNANLMHGSLSFSDASADEASHGSAIDNAQQGRALASLQNRRSGPAAWERCGRPSADLRLTIEHGSGDNGRNETRNNSQK
jgi:hypothetical protein